MLKRWLGTKTEVAYALLRTASGALFAFHGMQKLFGVLSPSHAKMLSQMWIGGIIELVTGTLIAIGCGTTCAAFVASGQMAVAYVQFHWKLALGAMFLPAINKGKLGGQGSQRPGREATSRPNHDPVVLSVKCRELRYKVSASERRASAKLTPVMHRSRKGQTGPRVAW